MCPDVGAPAVVAARHTAPVGDVVLVTRPPAGRPLSDLTADTVDDADICAAWRSLQRLDAAGIAVHMSLDHRVSQGIYISDPDGNLIELYVDADETLWRRDPSLVASSDSLML